MPAGALEPVLAELFQTIGEAEANLERFTADRNDGVPLQLAINDLQQARGVLSVVEVNGAKWLVAELLQLAMDIPVGAGADRNEQLACLGTGLTILRRYLESLSDQVSEIPELLLPAINEIRGARGQPLLPEGFFFSVPLDRPRPDDEGAGGAPMDAVAAGRLRHMYQLGLLGYLRDAGTVINLKLMERALDRLASGLASHSARRLSWIGAAAVESMHDGELQPRKQRKQLLSRFDRELKRALVGDDSYEAPAALLKEFLYLIALANTQGPRASVVRSVFDLRPMPFSDAEFETRYQRLAGPGRDVLRSVAAAIDEELATLRELLDLLGRATADEHAVERVRDQLERLAGTLEVIGLSASADALRGHLASIADWAWDTQPPAAELASLADLLLATETEVHALAQTEGAGTAESPVYAQNQLVEAQRLVVVESLAEFVAARRSLTAYLESDGDRSHLEPVCATLASVVGGLRFIGESRGAELVDRCLRFVRERMLDDLGMPSPPILEALADALASLEYFLESGGQSGRELSDRALALAEESLRALGERTAVA